ncbi:MAG TPA: hypothetical protein VMV69_04140 [Pirellulales bacterium]|nr:hypothetical protein [Pirellulales bacterium]
MKSAKRAGRRKHARSSFAWARQKFGKAPTKRHQKVLEAIADLARLEDLAERLLHVDSWGELLSEG